MPDKQLPGWVSILAFALWGGGVAYLQQIAAERRRFQWGAFAAKLAVAGFAGEMVVLLGDATGISPAWHEVAAGIAGFLGTEAVNGIKLVVLRKFAISPPEAREGDQ